MLHWLKTWGSGCEALRNCLWGGGNALISQREKKSETIVKLDHKCQDLVLNIPMYFCYPHVLLLWPTEAVLVSLVSPVRASRFLSLQLWAFFLIRNVFMYTFKNSLWQAGHYKSHELFVHGLKLWDAKFQTHPLIKLSALSLCHSMVTEGSEMVITQCGCLNSKTQTCWLLLLHCSLFQQ